MRIDTHYRCSLLFASCLIVAACSDSESKAIEDSVASVSPLSLVGAIPVDSAFAATNDSLAITIDSPITVSGRVADGSINGATVCADVNRNSACETDEPSTITVEGGLYELYVPVVHKDKPIVAYIPAEAIDEGTGNPMGTALILTTPADRPQFVSPITTLIHHEQHANPALDSSEAEQVVKDVLGIGESNISLFSDYVAQSNPLQNNDGTETKLLSLRDTARIVASMMRDITSQVKTIAISKGVDTSGDLDTRRAIHGIVLDEIRQILPQIAREVGLVGSHDRSPSTSTSSAELVEVDMESVSLPLRLSIESDSVIDRIEANKNRIEWMDSDLQTLLIDGLYWIEFDCDYQSHQEVRLSGFETVVHDDTQSVGSTNTTSQCAAFYGRAQLSAEGTNLVSEFYRFDVDGAAWISLTNSDLDSKHDYSLINGEWIMSYPQGPNGQTEFLNRSSAVVTNKVSTTTLKSVTQVLDGAPVLHHLLKDDRPTIWFEFIDSADLFSSESEAHRISVRQSGNPYVLHKALADDNQTGDCANYNGNCNVIEALNGSDTTVMKSIAQLQESSLSSIDLRIPSNLNSHSLLRLTADIRDDGQLPVEGQVEWFSEGHVPAVDYFISSRIHESDVVMAVTETPVVAQLLLEDECLATLSEQPSRAAIGSNVPVDLFAPGEFEGTRDELAALIGSRPITPVDLFAPGEFEGTRDELAALIGSRPVTPVDLFAPGEFEGTRDELAALIGSRPITPVDLFAPGEFEGTRDELAALIGTGLPVVENTVQASLEAEVIDDKTDALVLSQGNAAPCSLQMTQASSMVGNEDNLEIVLADLPVDPTKSIETDFVDSAQNGRWKLVNVDGVEMIEIYLPIPFRSNANHRKVEALLLVEHMEFLRAGARLSSTSVSPLFTYNENAFATMRSIVEEAMSGIQ